MPFAINDTVQMINDPTRVGKVESLLRQHAGVQFYNVFWGGQLGTRTVGEFDLVAYQVIDRPTDAFVRNIFGSYGDFQRVITLQRLVRDQPLRNNVYAFNASRTRFFPYQFKPLLKFLNSARHRLLICDEVGLGKTIEAGLILLELRARQTTRLVLVVCPSNLRYKWKNELRVRFGEDFAILDSKRLTDFLDDYAETPDRTTLNGVVSLETIRTPRIRERLEEIGIPFDLVIFDEAHHLRNFSTSQREAAVALTASAQAVVMLTATPVQLGRENLFSLLNLLDDEDFPDDESSARRFEDNELVVRAQAALGRTPPMLEMAADLLDAASANTWIAAKPALNASRARLRAMLDAPALVRPDMLLDLRRDMAELNLLGHILTRTRKRDVHEDVAVRRAFAPLITFNEHEQRLYDAVTRVIQLESERRQELPVVAKWRLNTPQRRLASSVHGMVDFYRDQLGTTAPPSDDELTDAGASLATDSATEDDLRMAITELVRAWPIDAPDTKYACLTSVLDDLIRTGRAKKVIVFATFKHTIRYLDRRLRANGYGVVAISGDVKHADRPGLIRRFEEDDTVTVLLSSRVGSEGLDFQFCSTVVNYDLPWNPMEVEQRIGRVDRIGQRSPTIEIVNLWVQGTIEERILRRLYERVGIFERSIGDLEPIIGEIAEFLQQELLRAPGLDEREAAAAADRAVLIIEQKRRDLENLEQTAASFVGVDDFFEEEVAAVRSRRRYVTPVQLYRFLRDFLAVQAPRTQLEYDFSTHRGHLAPDESLRQFLRASGKASESIQVLAAVGNRLPITLDAETAYRAKGLAFVNVLHPIVTAVAAHYQMVPGPVAAQHVALKTKTMPPGFYPFVVYRVRAKAARAFNSLEAVFVRDDFSEACDSGTAEELLGEMVENGTAAELPVELDPTWAQAAVDACEQLFLERLQQFREVEQSANSSFVDQRLSSLEAYFRKNIGKKRELLDRGVSAQRKENYLRMLRGHIARLEAERDTGVRALETLRHVTTEHDEIASGILEVVGERHA